MQGCLEEKSPVPEMSEGRAMRREKRKVGVWRRLRRVWVRVQARMRACVKRKGREKRRGEGRGCEREFCVVRTDDRSRIGGERVRRAAAEGCRRPARVGQGADDYSNVSEMVQATGRAVRRSRRTRPRSSAVPRVARREDSCAQTQTHVPCCAYVQYVAYLLFEQRLRNCGTRRRLGAEYAGRDDEECAERGHTTRGGEMGRGEGKKGGQREGGLA